MGRVLTKNVSQGFAREATPGVLPGSPVWLGLEPNSIPNFGNKDTKTARAPITKDRQRRKGKTVDRDSGFEIDSDLTLSQMRDLAEGVCYAALVGPDVFSPSATSGASYTVPAVSAAAAGRLLYGASSAKSLLYARGFATAGNNGLKVLGATVSSGGTAISVSGLTAEASPPTDHVVELAIAGVRGATGDIEIDANGDLISTALNFTTLGLTAGQVIWVGGSATANKFANAANTGFARVVSVASGKIELDRREQAFATDDGSGKAIDILFGQFCRNVASDHADYLEPTYHLELTSPGLGDSDETMYEYATGNYVNSMSASIPLTEKATFKCSFVGMKTTEPSASRASGASSMRQPSQTEAFGTASDIGRLRLAKLDEEGLSTDFKSLTITINNNASGEKVLGYLGNKYVNTGLLEVDVEMELLFTDADVIAAVNNDTDVGITAGVKNEDGGVFFDLPCGTLEGQDRDFRTNESVTIKSKFMSHKDPTLGTSLGLSFFPYLPA